MCMVCCIEGLQYLTNVGFILFYCSAVSDEDEENQDTVEQILKCIIENEGDKEWAQQFFLFLS